VVVVPDRLVQLQALLAALAVEEVQLLTSPAKRQVTEVTSVVVVVQLFPTRVPVVTADSVVVVVVQLA